MASPELVINGYGDGYGDSSGYGYGDSSGSGYGDGDGYGHVYGYGYGDGHGSGYGSGYGYGDSSGYGSGYGEIEIKKKHSWLAYHYIKKSPNGTYVLRSGKHVARGETITEPRIKMCEHGLHASLLWKDARTYAPYDSVLTKVKVWGRIICHKDKLVATNRQIIEEIESTDAAAREALLHGDTKEALRRLEIIIGRVETIISMRKSWRPTCVQTKENNDEHNRSTEISESKSSGGIGRSGPAGLFSLGEQLRSMVGENETSTINGNNDKEHHGGEPARAPGD